MKRLSKRSRASPLLLSRSSARTFQEIGRTRGADGRDLSDKLHLRLGRSLARGIIITKVISCSFFLHRSPMALGLSLGYLVTRPWQNSITGGVHAMPSSRGRLLARTKITVFVPVNALFAAFSSVHRFGTKFSFARRVVRLQFACLDRGSAHTRGRHDA